MNYSKLLALLFTQRHFVGGALFSVLLGLCLSCGSVDEDEYKLPSTGGTLEIVVVMDSAKYRGPLGDALYSVLSENIPGLPRIEPRFHIISIPPQYFGRFLKQHHSVVFVTPLNDNSKSGRRMKQLFTPATLRMIEADESKFMIPQKDEYAKNQKLLYIFGKDDQQIIDNLAKKKREIQEYFYQSHRVRLAKRLFGKENDEQVRLSKLIKKETGLSIQIPYGYQVAKIDSNFLWLRNPGTKADRSILITYGNYSSQEMFSDSSIVKWRNYFGYKYMNDTTLNKSYMSTQDLVIPLKGSPVTIKGQYAQEYRGLWKLQNNTRGGPLVGYAFVDQTQNRFYYIEGFLYKPEPKEKQRMDMFELEVILRTLQVPSPTN